MHSSTINQFPVRNPSDNSNFFPKLTADSLLFKGRHIKETPYQPDRRLFEQLYARQIEENRKFLLSMNPDLAKQENRTLTFLAKEMLLDQLKKANANALESAAQSAKKVEPLWTKQLIMIGAALTGFRGYAAGMSATTALEYGAVTVKEFLEAKAGINVFWAGGADEMEYKELETVAKHNVYIKGTIRIDKKEFAKTLAEDYAKRLAAAELVVPQDASNRPARIGQAAEIAWVEFDVPARARQFGIPQGKVLIRPISGVTGPKGGQTRFDVQFDLGREYISIEVKKSMYQDPCNTWQAESHLIATAEGTSTGGRPSWYFRYYGQERVVHMWTTEDLLKRDFHGLPRGRR